MKKKRLVYALSALVLLGGPLALSSCDGGQGVGPVTPDPEDDTKVASYEISLSSDKALNVGETVYINVSAKNSKGATVEAVAVFRSSDEAIATVESNGLVKAVGEGVATITVRIRNGVDGLASKTIDVTVLGEAEVAEGAYNYAGYSYEEKLEILGKLESYAVDHHLTGITLFQNGGYVMYSNRIAKPVNEYITGYGFGILSEGSITEPMSATAESNEDWRMYYHSFGGTTNKQKFNYLDDTGSESSDLYGYVSSTFYGTKLNSTKNGYDYYPVLAKPSPREITYEGKTIVTENEVRPIALNLNSATKLASKYRVYVRTGKDGLRYATLSSRRQAFNGRDVQIEDYITPYKLLLNQKIGLARSTDMISDTNEGTLKGAKAFYNLSADNSNIEDLNDTFYRMVGISHNEDEYGEYIDFTFNTPITPFSAMLNVSSSLTSPIPADFIKEIAPDKSSENVFESGMKDAYGTTIKDTDYSPVDNLLSLSPYVLEQVGDTYNVYKRNDDWFERRSEDPTIANRNQIAGIKICYFQGQASDVNFAFTQFIQNNSIDAISIPMKYINDYKNDPRTTKTQGDSTFKLNLNTCTNEQWKAIFNKGGATESYNCKPLMSNDDFVNAISYAIDRQTFAENRGNIPSQSYFAPAYLWEPEKGLSYDETEQHKAAIANYSPATYGYNEDLAVQLFDRAIEEEVMAKKSYSGYNSSETIRIEWMNTTDADEYGKEIANYLNTAFEKTQAYKKGFRINWEQGEGNTNYQVVYDIMKSGKFDIGFGAISGMTNDPLGFMEVLKSNNATGFTLNYGVDTSVIGENSYIIYDGKKWSYDALWTAAKKGAIVGSDTRVIEEPITLAQAGSGSTETTITMDGQTIGVRQLAFDLKKAEAAQATTFKLYDGEESKKDCYVTITISYKDGKITKATALNATLGEMKKSLFSARNGDINEDGTFKNNTARLYIFVPTTLNAATTDSQITNEITWDKIEGINVTVTYFMEIAGIAVSNSLDLDLSM